VSEPGTLRDGIASALEEAYDLWRMANTNEPYPEMFAPLADAVLVVVKARRRDPRPTRQGWVPCRLRRVALGHAVRGSRTARW